MLERIAIALFDADPALRALLEAEEWAWPVELLPPGSAEGDLAIWNLSQHPQDIQQAFQELRQANLDRAVLFVYDREEHSDEVAWALRNGAVDALSKKAHDGRRMLEIIRRFVQERHTARARDNLIEGLVDRSYMLSIFNGVLEGINESQDYEALYQNTVVPLLELSGAQHGTLLLPYGRIGTELADPGGISSMLVRAQASGSYCWEASGDRYLAAFPLMAKREYVGSLVLSGNAFLLSQLHSTAGFIQSLCGQIAMAVSALQHVEEMKRLATYDGLTGLFNHAHFQAQLNAEFDRARRYERPLALVMLDVDFFKRINDTYGHPAGDVVLIELAALLKRTLRKVDTPARYGGEEFSLILPETGTDGANLVSERLRQTISTMRLSTPRGVEIGPITASFGIAELGTCDDAPQHLIQRADMALYRSKHAGRNRVSLAEPVS